LAHSVSTTTPKHSSFINRQSQFVILQFSLNPRFQAALSCIILPVQRLLLGKSGGDVKVHRSAIRSAPGAILILALALPVVSPRGSSGGPKVLNGIDVLRRQNFAPLMGKRVGLITNHTGLAQDGTPTIDLISGLSTCKLVALFSPEHGIRGILDSNVEASMDEKTGIPIYSLYGDTRRPTAEMLAGIDVLVYDIQDIGARFYTYITTLGYCLEEAAKAGIPLFVLDRPNPIGGQVVEGPMLDPDKTSFIGYMPLPVRHGMTIGELARYFNNQNKVGADLHVIEMEGWARSYYFWDTGQLWVNPSPNMRSVVAAIFYPGVCLLEATNVSVGRGTDKPFEVFGAPWIEPRRLAEVLESLGLPGVRFVPLYFTPDASVHQGIRCGGVNLILTDVRRFQSVTAGMAIVSALNKLYPEKFEIDKVLRLLGNEKALQALKAGQSAETVSKQEIKALNNFLDKRRKALIYNMASERKEEKK
jgi:uncharacterized protein YbbC (DUF1343 family)